MDIASNPGAGPFGTFTLLPTLPGARALAEDDDRPLLRDAPADLPLVQEALAPDLRDVGPDDVAQPGEVPKGANEE